MDMFFIPLILIICAHFQALEGKGFHVVGSRSQAEPALRENTLPEDGLKSPQPKISGGVTASLGEIPFQVSVHIDSNNFHGGVIIHPKFILTDAHIALKGSTFTIYAGVIKRLGDESSRQVMITTEKYVHEDYNTTYQFANIAILKLPEPFQFNQYVSAALIPPHDVPFTNYTAKISGWGSYNEDGVLSPTLQVASVRVMSNEECRGPGGWGDFIIDSVVCAQGDVGVGECEGDRGGPLFTSITRGTSFLIGTLSFRGAYECGAVPSVFIRISSFRSWITTHLR